MDSYHFCDRFDWESKNSEFWARERWRKNSERWHHTHSCQLFVVYFLASEVPPLGECRQGWRYFWILPDASGLRPCVGPTLKRPCAVLVRWWDGEQIVSQSVSYQKFAFIEFCLFVSVHRPLQILSLSLSLSLVLLYAVWTSNKKWLLIVDGEIFLFLSCQHPGNFVPTDYCDRQKFRMDCVIPCLWIFQTQTGLINELPENTFGSVTRIRPWKSATQPDVGFDPKNQQRNHKQDSSLKTHCQVMVIHFVRCKRIKRIVVRWRIEGLHLVLRPA